MRHHSRSILHILQSSVHRSHTTDATLL